MGEIYILTSKTGKKSYVGQALDSFSNGKRNASQGRWLTHLADLNRKTPSCPYLTNAIRKYGPEDFTLEVLVKCEESQLNFYEEKFIKTYGTLAPRGYNLNTGGGNGRRHSDASRAKMSAARAERGRIKKETGSYPIPKKKQADYSTQKSQQKHKPENLPVIQAVLDEFKLKHLPLYIVFHERRRPEWGDGFMVRVPKLKTKTFTSQALTMSEKFRLAVKHLKTLISETGVGSATLSEQLAGLKV